MTCSFIKWISQRISDDRDVMGVEGVIWGFLFKYVEEVVPDARANLGELAGGDNLFVDVKHILGGLFFIFDFLQKFLFQAQKVQVPGIKDLLFISIVNFIPNNA